MTAGKPPLVLLCHLWKRVDYNAKTYYIGKLGNSRILAFPSDGANGEPDLKLYLGQQIEAEKISLQDRFRDAKRNALDQEPAKI